MTLLPDLYKERMKSVLGEAYYDYEASFEQPISMGLRINDLKLDKSKWLELSPFPVEQVPWVSNGFYFHEDVQPAKHPYYHAGLYYIQEPSAMTPASILQIEKGDKVLDLCAAPGGKSTQLGTKLAGTGLLVCNDISASRAKGLVKNIELFGITNALITAETPERLASCFEGFFDKVLVDAPLFRRRYVS